MINSLFPISFKKSQLFCVSLALYELLTYIGSDAIMPGMLTVVTDMQANASYVPCVTKRLSVWRRCFSMVAGPAGWQFLAHLYNLANDVYHYCRSGGACAFSYY
ncbi:hypothetical protein PU372_003472 [Salmonella enterica]|uniref:Uncharacterized protein n=1 Tax=Salmonella enterica subsp. houtenae serovar 48:z4,z32:- TaxID=2577535 RepID=A0A729G895_SALHO|nr:hypothetical protein [Salmonella enterica]ECZ5452698.1 hypothetical protein [Salmonella enterica subsp. houtenae]EEA9137697.1 hypothetical protein [Salmonella enterica subsp. enterica]EKR1448402.1 hypothetical protein [Salmonella enterica subsp. houtenae serovar 48:z4,z32:-]ECR8695454.1 hypothetical protein [Salmonella enterica]